MARTQFSVYQRKVGKKVNDNTTTYSIVHLYNTLLGQPGRKKFMIRRILSTALSGLLILEMALWTGDGAGTRDSAGSRDQ